MGRLAPILLVFALATAGPTEAAKIESLIQSVAHLERAVFIRNGSTYDAKAAADHLRRKLANAGSRVKTAEDFIRYCGSASSMTGRPYQIRYDDGRVVTSEAFLRARLAELDAQE
jgi:Family of unknown function (DUF5329)